jgi:hypothetical protein
MPRDEREWLPPPEETSRLWDTFLAGEASSMGGPDSPSEDDPDQVIAEVIRAFHALDDTPAPDTALRERIWQEALVRSGLTAAPASVNGRGHAGDLRSTTEVIVAARPAPGRAWAALLGRWTRLTVREVGIAILAGALAGFFVVGGGARLIMRISAILADPSLQGTLTENGERIGDVTFSGTLALMVFCMIGGAIGGFGYALVKPWLPWSGWRRGLIFGLLLTLTIGSVVLEGGDNPDYARLGIPFLNVCLFNLLPLGFGLATVLLVEAMDRLVPRDLAAASLVGRIGRLATFGGLGLLSLPMVLLLLAGITGFDLVTLAMIGLLLIRLALTRWVGRFERPSDLFVRPAAFVTAYAVLLLPVGFGLALTLRAASRIIGNG